MNECQATFPPMYYSSLVEQEVLEFAVAADDSLTASITTGSQYFKVSKIDICNPVAAGRTPAVEADAAKAPAILGRPIINLPRASAVDLSAPVATSNGKDPLIVKSGQYARIWVTASVDKGALEPGKFTGAVVVKGKSSTKTVTLEGMYLGTLVGKVIVEPATVVPGQPVLVQVCDAFGKPHSDPTVAVLIDGVPVSSRYCQFPTPGKRTLVVAAARGDLRESVQATVEVTGTPLAFRSSLTPPAATSIPMLKANPVAGQPYAVTFTLGNTASVRRFLVKARVANRSQPAPAPQPQNPESADELNTELAKVLATLPAEKIMRFAPPPTRTATGLATSSGVLAEVGLLQIKPAATSYRWDFGDGQTLTTQSSTVTHDYFEAIQPGKVVHNFDVTCTVLHDNVIVKRTLVLHSAYGLCKRLGIIVPPVTGTLYANFHHVAFSALLIVHNLEASPITLNGMACVPLSDDASVALPAPQFRTMQIPVVVAANSASAIGVYIPLNELQLGSAQVNGFCVYYKGQMQAVDGTSMPVRFSYAFRIRLSDSGLPNSLASQLSHVNLDMNIALKAVIALSAQGPNAVSKPGSQIVDPATKTVAIALSANARNHTTVIQARAAAQAGLTSIALSSGVLTATGSILRRMPLAPRPPVAVTPRLTGPVVLYDFKFDPSSPPPVAAGNECYPDDISDAAAAAASAQQLVCQLTGVPHTVEIPGSFQNAQAGDIILSPSPVGGGDLIGTMFRALIPPQHHGHSGIMTLNFFEITHCTASVERITANINTDAIGIPTSLKSNMLQYAWPGSLTQSVHDATTEVHLKDPSGTPYPMNSFNTDAQGEAFEVIPPLVVKPLPEHEAAARPLLRKAADTARSKGAQYDDEGKLVRKGGCYYSFFAYTDPQVSAGFTDPGGADAGWAQGLSPAVCSSFVWLSLKENNIPLVTSNQFEKASDFTPTAAKAGARVGPATLDGLVFYPEAERQKAAQALYQMFMNQALSKEDGLGTLPGVNEAIAGPIADQLLNDFAFGNPNMTGSSAWQKPGDGNAVSPDNIACWNPPYFGYPEPLQYLPTHTEQYTISKWVKVTRWGSIKGVVRANGVPVANAHVWVYLPKGDFHTGADGTYNLSHVPIGSYSLKAQAVITANAISAEYTNGFAGQQITLSAANSNLVQDIDLHLPPDAFRRLDIIYALSCDHGDDNPFNTHGFRMEGPLQQSMDVNPGQVTNKLTYTYDYAGGGYFHIDYKFMIQLLDDFSVKVNLIATMHDDGSGDVQLQNKFHPFNVPMGATRSGWMSMEHANGYHNGPAKFTFSVTNKHQTG